MTEPQSGEERDDVDFSMDNILNTKQTQSIQSIVSILQKFIKHNAMLVEYIQQSRQRVDSFWVHNDACRHQKKAKLRQLHKLNLDVESIVSTMCIKDLIHTKSSSCHNILFHDILGCANTKQFFTRIYFIVSIWYSFFHALHNDDEHAKLESDDDSTAADEHDEHHRHTPCNSYLTKLFAMTDFSFLTKTSTTTSASASTAGSAASSTASLTSPRSTAAEPETAPDTPSAAALTVSRARRHENRENRDYNQRREQSAHNRYSPNMATRTSSAESASAYNWTSRSSSVPASPSPSPEQSQSKNDFLLKYLNAQNNYLQSIWYDGIALLEYSLHLLQQQEFRLSCRVAHRCLELFQKQQADQRRLRHQQRQNEHWNQLGQDLYDEAELREQAEAHGAAGSAIGGGTGIGGGGGMMADPLVAQPAQIPGLWYIEMHLANCYHTWGQSNMALYHINRTLDQLGNYHINPDTLTVRLNSRRKFQMLSAYLVQATRKSLAKQRRQRRLDKRGHSPKQSSLPLIHVDVHVEEELEAKGNTPETEPDVDEDSKEDDTPRPGLGRRHSFMHKIKMNNRRRRKSNMFAKLFDRFSSGRTSKRQSKDDDDSAASSATQSRDNSGSPSATPRNHSGSQSRSRTLSRTQSHSIRVDVDTGDATLAISDWQENALLGSNNTSRCSSASASRSPSASASRCMSMCDEDSKDDAEFDPESLQLCLEEDLNLKLSEDTDNELPDDDELEIEFFHNEPDHASDSESLSSLQEHSVSVEQEPEAMDGAQLITLEALLSMHMTKGRILIEMKLLREALELYTYIIDECEALIKYHSLVNPHHIQLEREFDQFEEHRREMAQSPSSRRQRRRRLSRRRSHRDAEDYAQADFAELDHAEDLHLLGGGGHRMGRLSHPLPNTPFRRLAKNVGLENYYAARGDIYFKFKDLKHALADFSNAIKYGKCKKEKGIYYNLRGVCFHELKQYERALRDYDNAVKSMYGNHVAWNNRAALLVDMGQFDDAIENANNAIKLDPSYGNAYKHRGVAYHLKCEYEKAITDINRCIKLLPNYRPARLALLAIWKDIFECVRVVNSDEGVPLDLVKIMVDYTVGNGYEIDEYMVNFTYC